MSIQRSEKAQRVVDNFTNKLNRQALLALGTCAHCGICNDSCHYYLATGDPKMTPAYKVDKIRKLFKYHKDWLGRLAPWWVKGATLTTDQDLEELKDIVYGSCTMCRRCTVNCPFGVDTALVMRFARGLITKEGVAPEGVLAVMKDQWETGNQMAVSQEDYIETLEWLEEELQNEVGDKDARIPIDKQGANIMFVINPREIKYAPLSLLAAAKIFYLVGEDWTMPSEGWDNTNFGLFSGDDSLGAHMGKLAYDQAERLGVSKMVASECGHGFRSIKWEAPNWAKTRIPIPIESFLETMVEYVNTGRIILNPRANPDPVTYHDPCNLSRSSGITEEPRLLLMRSCMDFREMTPNRQDSFCCTGGGGAMSMSEYAPRRLVAAKVKADQITATGAGWVATACHNCQDGLSDLIRHYKINARVRNVCEFVADAAIIPRKVQKAEPDAAREEVAGMRVLIIDDEPDIRDHLHALFEDNGLKVETASSGMEGMAKAKQGKPDLITLDVTMPGKSGVKVFADLRSDPRTADIPIYIITGTTDFRSLMYQREMRAPEAFMGKPIDGETLMLTVRRILEHEQRARTPKEKAASA